MKCHQCNNNAMYLEGPKPGIPLCLNCYTLVQQNKQRQNDGLAELVNFFDDSLDAVVGFDVGLARFPVKSPIIVSGGTVNNNHIAINNSQIGVLNTGNIQNLNQTIDSLYSASQTELAENVQKFSQTVLNEQGLTPEQKNEVLESLDVLTKELFQQSGNRKKSLANFLMRGIAGTIGTSADALVIWQILQPLLQPFFS